jgi:hypothetical protein
MYIDSRVWRPGPGDGDSEEPRRRRTYDIPWRGIRWTLVVVWLFAASLVTSSGLAAAGFSYAGLLIAFWRLFAWVGEASGGLNDHKQ